MRSDIASSPKRFFAFLIDISINFSVIFAAVFYGKEVGGTNGIFVSLGFIISIMSVKMAFWYEGTTLGKNFLNLSIIDINTGNKLGFKKMFFRQTVGTLISMVVLNLGFIWILIDRNRQGWHDKIFNDFVIDERFSYGKIDHESDEYIQGY